MNIENTLKSKVFPVISVTVKGDLTYPNEGRIAHNIIVDTEEKGELLFRCYRAESSKSALGYGVEQAKFELKALSFFAEKKLHTPKPISFKNGQNYIEEDGWLIFAYPIEEGRTLEQCDLSAKVAKEAGELLAEIISVSSEYKPEGGEPNGDIDYIKTILNNFLKRRPDMSEAKIFNDLFVHLNDNNFLDELDKTPKGLVHGDFFFENILDRDGKIVGAIDFGDAYYGYPLMDITTGAMEFAMKEEEIWDYDFFKAFLISIKEWLQDNNISFSLFYYVLLANCGRFTAHLFNLFQDELEENGDPTGEIASEDNPYVERFYMFQSAEVKENLENCYNEVMG